MARNGYAWWYLDALSDDGRHGLTVIAFLGSVFSPWYAWARRRPGGADPMEHCALNVALYGERGRWAMTERPASAVGRGADSLRIGPSALHWDGASLRVQVREVAAPVPRRLRGEIRLRPAGATNTRGFILDPATRRHRWTPIAPAARVEVVLDEPALRWSGPAYFDTNDGDAPLEQDFVRWDWCRAPLRDGGAGVLYNVEPRDGAAHSLALRVRPGGEVEDAPPAPPSARLPPTRLWRMPRPFRAETGAEPAVVRTLEDTPFYARSVVSTRMFGEPAQAVHESLSLDRFRAPWVQAMLPFRVPRARR